jgi:hypothetical protein
MRSPSHRLAGVLAALTVALAACSGDTAEPRADTPASDGSILTSFDRLTLAPGGRATFRASLVDASVRLSSAGLAFASRTPAVARVSTANGRALVEGVAAGQTWVVVRSAAAADSVQVIVR